MLPAAFFLLTGFAACSFSDFSVRAFASGCFADVFAFRADACCFFPVFRVSRDSADGAFEGAAVPCWDALAFLAAASVFLALALAGFAEGFAFAVPAVLAADTFFAAAFFTVFPVAAFLLVFVFSVFVFSLAAPFTFGLFSDTVLVGEAVFRVTVVPAVFLAAFAEQIGQRVRRVFQAAFGVRLFGFQWLVRCGQLGFQAAGWVCCRSFGNAP